MNYLAITLILQPVCNYVKIGPALAHGNRLKVTTQNQNSSFLLLLLSQNQTFHFTSLCRSLHESTEHLFCSIVPTAETTQLLE